MTNLVPLILITLFVAAWMRILFMIFKRVPRSQAKAGLIVIGVGAAIEVLFVIAGAVESNQAACYGSTTFNTFTLLLPPVFIVAAFIWAFSQFTERSIRYRAAFGIINGLSAGFIVSAILYIEHFARCFNF